MWRSMMSKMRTPAPSSKTVYSSLVIRSPSEILTFYSSLNLPWSFYCYLYTLDNIASIMLLIFVSKAK